MKKKMSHLALSMSLFLALTACLSAFAQQPERHQDENRRTEKTANNFTTEKYYFTKNKLSKAALRRKLLKIEGVKKVDIDSRGGFINITFDSHQAPKDNLKRNLGEWGTPGDFNKPKVDQDNKPQGKRQQEPSRDLR